MQDQSQEVLSTDAQVSTPSTSEGKKKMHIAARIAIGVVLGAIAGFVWYRTVGCSGGSCPITSNPWTSMAYGGVMGALIASGK